MYFGEFLTKLDEKGRITVPRRIRETMDVHGHAIWYLTRGFDHCVFAFHRESWDDIRAQAGRYSSMDADALDFRRMFFGSMAEGRPDPQGRLGVAAHLREHAGLDKDVVVVGVDDHLELWNPETWRTFRESKDARYREMAAPLFAQRTPNPSGGEGDGARAGAPGADTRKVG